MQPKFKRHDKVKLLINPDPEFVEYHTENSNEEIIPITKGMTGEINLLMQNGQYHVKIFDKDGDEFAYVVVDEDFLEAI